MAGLPDSMWRIRGRFPPRLSVPQAERQDISGVSCGAGGGAAAEEELLWFTEIADEHDTLRRQILALQTQKVDNHQLPCRHT